MEGLPTGSLIVKPGIRDNVVLYWILVSKDDNTKYRVTRYSELSWIHGLLMKEVPSFKGRLPSKTLRRQFGKQFILRRTSEIQVYLRLAATDDKVRKSNTWRMFFPKKLQTDQQAKKTEKEQTKAGEGSEDESDSLAFNDEMREAMKNKDESLKNAKSTKLEIEGNLASGEEDVKALEEQAQTNARGELEAATRLRAHRVGLEELDSKLAGKRMTAGETEREKTQLATYIRAQLTAATAKVEAARVKVEDARRAEMNARAEGNTRIAQAEACKCAAEANYAGAMESHQAMMAAMALLKQRVNDREEGVKAAAREMQMLQSTKESVAAESLRAEEQRGRAENEATGAAAAVSSQISDAARRNRAHEVEIRRAQERVASLGTLRDMRTRGIVMGADRAVLESAEAAANDAAEAAADLLVKAEENHKIATDKDAEQLKVREAAMSAADQQLKYRETIASNFASRLEISTQSAHAASAKHASAVALLDAVQQELTHATARANGPLAEALAAAEKRLAVASDQLAVTRKAAEDVRPSLMHTIVAEKQLLKSEQAGEANLVQMLDEITMAAAEAHKDAQERGETEEQEKGSDVDFLLQSAVARLSDREREAELATKGYEECLQAQQQAQGALDAANLQMETASSIPAVGEQEEDAFANQSEVAAVGEEDEGSGDGKESEIEDGTEGRNEGAGEWDRKETERRASVIRASLLEATRATTEKGEISKAANAAVATAKEEVAVLRTQAEEAAAARQKGRALEVLIREELALTDQGLQEHEARASDIQQEAQRKLAQWTEEKAALAAKLHEAQLLVEVAETEKHQTKALAASLAKNK